MFAPIKSYLRQDHVLALLNGTRPAANSGVLSSRLINHRNKVPEYQRFYQTAYRNNTRVWKIVCRE